MQSNSGRILRKLQTLARRAAFARSQGQRPLLDQLRDLRQIRQLPGKLSVGDYYDLRLYEVAAQRPQELEQYMGWRMNREMDQLFNEDAWRATANDKILMYGLMDNLGVPIPRTRALYSPSGRSLPGAESFQDPDEFVAFLEQLTTPAFFKPNCGTYGRSSFAIQGFDASAGAWLLADGSTLTQEKLQRVLAFKPYHGVLVQEILQPHDSLRQLAGDSTSCVRLNVLRNGGSPIIFNGFWKISVGSNMTDNFGGGKHGNLIAQVDVSNGRVSRVIDGVAEQYREVELHPTTGERLRGFTLPDFERVLPMIKPAVIALEGLHFQHWDIAFTESGPVAMEINLEPDFHIIQLLRGRGILDEQMQRHIQARRDELRESRSAVALRAERPELGL